MIFFIFYIPYVVVHMKYLKYVKKNLTANFKETRFFLMERSLTSTFHFIPNILILSGLCPLFQVLDHYEILHKLGKVRIRPTTAISNLGSLAEQKQNRNQALLR